MSALKQEVLTANEQVSQLRGEVQALNKKSADLQAELAHAEQAHDALNQELEVILDPAVADLPWSLSTEIWPLLVEQVQQTAQPSLICFADISECLLCLHMQYNPVRRL